MVEIQWIQHEGEWCVQVSDSFVADRNPDYYVGRREKVARSDGSQSRQVIGEHISVSNGIHIYAVEGASRSQSRDGSRNIEGHVSRYGNRQHDVPSYVDY